MYTQTPILPLSTTHDYTAETRSRLETLTEEMASGKRSDPGRYLASDFSAFSKVAHELRTHDARASALVSAGTWMSMAQTSLAAVGTATERLNASLPANLSAAGFAEAGNIAGLAEGALSDMVAALEQRSEGRSIFGNGDPSGGALIDFDRIMQDTRALAAGATDVDSLLRAFDDYFGAGGGIDGGALKDFPASAAEFPLGSGRSLTMPFSASDAPVRNALKQAAILATLTETGFPLDETARAELEQAMPARGHGASLGLATMRGAIGAVEARVETEASNLEQARVSLETRKTDAIAADPYETASRLQAEMTKLETLYAITARRAQLRLTDYLR